MPDDEKTVLDAIRGALTFGLWGDALVELHKLMMIPAGEEKPPFSPLELVTSFPQHAEAVFTAAIGFAIVGDPGSAREMLWKACVLDESMKLRALNEPALAGVVNGEDVE